MSRGRLDSVRRVSGSCRIDVWKVSGRCFIKNFVSNQKFSDQEQFWTQHFVGPKNFLPNIFLPKRLLLNRHFLTQNILWFITSQLCARACGVPVGRRSGSQLATTLVATVNDIGTSVRCSSGRRSGGQLLAMT